MLRGQLYRRKIREARQETRMAGITKQDLKRACRLRGRRFG